VSVQCTDAACRASHLWHCCTGVRPAKQKPKVADLNVSNVVLFVGELFAQCPVESYPSAAVEQVLDSSRYFVVRIQDGGG